MSGSDYQTIPILTLGEDSPRVIGQIKIKSAWAEVIVRQSETFLDGLVIYPVVRHGAGGSELVGLNLGFETKK